MVAWKCASVGSAKSKPADSRGVATTRKGARDQFGGEHRLHRPEGERVAVGQDQQVISETVDEVEIMQ